MNVKKNPAQSEIKNEYSRRDQPDSTQSNFKIFGELTINFNSNSTVISDKNQDTLKTFLQHFNYNQSSTIRISGHTDASGNQAGNILLSKKRAESVKHFLIAGGILPQRVQTTGYGESQPVADNSSKLGQRKNRRAELLVYN